MVPLYRPPKHFGDAMAEQEWEVIDYAYQIPSSNLCLSQAPASISVPNRYSHCIEVNFLILQWCFCMSLNKQLLTQTHSPPIQILREQFSRTIHYWGEAALAPWAWWVLKSFYSSIHHSFDMGRQMYWTDQIICFILNTYIYCICAHIEENKSRHIMVTHLLILFVCLMPFFKLSFENFKIVLLFQFGY